MKRTVIIASFFACLFGACCPSVDFSAYTIPESDSLETSCDAVRNGDVWEIEVRVCNNTAETQSFKLALAAEPGFKADSWLIPGVNYDGNPYGENMPQGWEKDGQPWVFAYDRSSIPSCTISENASRVFALFASDADTASYVSACSMEKLSDGSFRHIIYWPDSEGPVCYSGKKSFTERYDNYITLQSGESFKVKAFACTGKPEWRNYGFAEVFPVAWKHLRHDTPSRRSMTEVVRLDKAFQDWSRRQDEHGYWYGGIVDDQVFCAGYYESGKSSDGFTVADYDANPSLNRWATDEIEQSKHLAPGEYVYGAGRSIGFGAQSFQMARLSIENGLRNGVQEDVDFGLAVFRSWNRERRFASGLYNSHKPRAGYVINASNVGWAISELSRTSALLKEYGREEQAEEFRQAATLTVKTVLDGVQDDGCIGSLWNAESGEVAGRGGDSAGYVLMGLVRWWQLVRDESLLPLFKNAFAYYYSKDIDFFRCSGGAMDCVSVDREGIHPFLTAAMALYRETGEKEYLEYAHKAAWYFLSWLYIHNPVYGPDTDFAKFDWKPAGATIVGAEHPALDEYACVLIPEFMELARIDGNPMWRDVAALIWRYSTQGFADEHNRIWHGLERPVGSKNEAIFPTRWSKYHLADKARGSINDHLTAWGGTYRLAALLELQDEDLRWLENAVRPAEE